jgi:hypothetical protein
MKISFVRLLGVFAIAHALSHAILPVRGSFDAGLLLRDYTPIILYVVSTMAFLIAGVGLLGLRALNAFISPLLVLGAALSSVAIVRFGDWDFALGIALNAAFFALGLWRGYAGWPVSDAEQDDFAHVWPPASSH